MHFKTHPLASQRRAAKFKSTVCAPFNLPTVVTSSIRLCRARLVVRCRQGLDHDLPSKISITASSESMEENFPISKQIALVPQRESGSLWKYLLLSGIFLGAIFFTEPSYAIRRHGRKSPFTSQKKQEDRDKKKRSSEGDNLPTHVKIERGVLQKLNEKSRKKGRKVDPMKSYVPNPDDLPDENSPEVQEVMSLWTLDKLREVTYTQFWQLVRDGYVERAKYSNDARSLKVKLKESAPGGAREVKIGLPYDPDLYNFLLRHDVFIEKEKESLLSTILFMMIRLAFPIIICYCLVQVSFRIGQKESEDDVFGGANLDMMHSKESTVNFKDIAGIDQIKEEIKEIVAFLRNPKRFTEMGARSPAGILLVGPPGTGKTLLAKAIAGESQVPFFSTAGTEFAQMYVGVGAARVRDMFEKAREAAPCILFIDEFDGIGQKRAADGNDESVHTINQLLTEMDGFEDNSGVIVVAATNRPNALDTAVTRPGRFDRVIHLPLPNVTGRVEIMKVHARDKLFAKEVDLTRVSRATAGFTGAQLMNLMNQAAVVAVRHKRSVISEIDVFDALEELLMEKKNRGSVSRGYDQDIVPKRLRKVMAIYEAGKALIGLMSPAYDEVYKVSVCPGGVPSGTTFFLPREDRLESRVVTRGYMESKMVISLAGRCVERILLGDANISTSGAADLNRANAVAKEMVYRYGFSKYLGPVALMDAEDGYLADQLKTTAVANISTDIARIAFEECRELLDSAEAKAYYGLVMNFDAINPLVELLLEKETIGLDDLNKLCHEYRISQYESPHLEGFGWDSDGNLIYPGINQGSRQLKRAEKLPGKKEQDLLSWWDPANPYKIRTDLDAVLHNGFSKTSGKDIE